MRILIGTPAGGGLVTIPFMTSFLATVDGIAKVNQQHFPQGGGFQIGLYTLTHEALLPRGRNHIAQVSIQAGWDKLFFIDADAGWTFDQFMAVATALGEIVAGTCPLKTYPISLNYLPFQDDEHYYQDAIRSIESMRAMREGHGTPIIKVPFVGTAFMCINTNVFRRLSEVAEPYQYPNPTTGQNETHWDFFPTAPIKKMYMSEDWGFCDFARKNGIDVYIHADVCITHTGSHTFRAPPFSALNLRPKAEHVAASVPVAGEKVTAIRSSGIVEPDVTAPREALDVAHSNT